MGEVRFRCVGSAPLIQHNGRLSNPFDPFAVAIKEVTAKKKKTEEDCLAIYWLEWCGSLYSEKMFKPSEAQETVVRPIIPESNLLSFINDGARHVKRGPDVWRGVQILSGNALILGTGWPEKKKLGDVYKLGDYCDIRSIVNPSTGGRSMRSRPIFREWSIEFTAMFDDEILSRSDLISWVERAARYNGLCDGKPLFGRCKAEVIEDAKIAAA